MTLHTVNQGGGGNPNIYTLEDERLEHDSMEVWFRSFSFPNGKFVGSMLIFQGVHVKLFFHVLGDVL